MRVLRRKDVLMNITYKNLKQKTSNINTLQDKAVSCFFDITFTFKALADWILYEKMNVRLKSFHHISIHVQWKYCMNTFYRYY